MHLLDNKVFLIVIDARCKHEDRSMYFNCSYNTCRFKFLIHFLIHFYSLGTTFICWSIYSSSQDFLSHVIQTHFIR